ncbi:MAG: hypothetical protein R3F37_07795 [Candidatus Competibacteraceae bacterium]
MNGICQRCGASGSDGDILDNDNAALIVELSFSDEELEKFGVILSSEHGNANPPEWGNDPFTDFT